MAQTINFSDATPAAPAGGVNVKWQNDSSNPPNISAYVNSVPTGGGAITGAQFPSGINNFNTAAQATQLVAATPLYIAGSKIALPAVLVNGIVIGSALTWKVRMKKDANGTGAFTVLIYMGTNGTTADTAEVTQQITASQTAAIDDLFLDVMLVFTAVGNGTASFYWSICAENNNKTSGAGFGLTTGTSAVFSGTVSSLNTTTASLIFGLAIQSAAGGTMETPTITYVESHAFNLD